MEGVLVGVLLGVRVGVLVGVRVDVAFAWGPRVRVGGRGVQVIKTLTVGGMEAVQVGEAVIVRKAVGNSVGVGIYSDNSTAVNATAVLIGLEKAASTIS